LHTPAKRIPTLCDTPAMRIPSLWTHPRRLSHLSRYGPRTSLLTPAALHPRLSRPPAPGAFSIATDPRPRPPCIPVHLTPTAPGPAETQTSNYPRGVNRCVTTASGFSHAGPPYPIILIRSFHSCPPGLYDPATPIPSLCRPMTSLATPGLSLRATCAPAIPQILNVHSEHIVLTLRT